MNRKLPITLLAVAAMLVVAASSVWAAGSTVNVMQDTAGHAYLTDGKGMTLYYFTKDTPGVSMCTGPCLTNWPPLLDEQKPTLGKDLEAKDFGNIVTPAGHQVTFRGYPLYTFFKDAKPGDTLGQGVKGVWFVVDPANFPPKN